MTLFDSFIWLVNVFHFIVCVVLLNVLYNLIGPIRWLLPIRNHGSNNQNSLGCHTQWALCCHNWWANFYNSMAYSTLLMVLMHKCKQESLGCSVYALQLFLMIDMFYPLFGKCLVRTKPLNPYLRLKPRLHVSLSALSL